MSEEQLKKLMASQPSREEIQKSKEEKRQKRESIIQSAINSGVPVDRCNAGIPLEDQETIVCIESDGTVFIDTTFRPHINKMIDRGYQITKITQSENNGVVGMSFKTDKSKITFRMS